MATVPIGTRFIGIATSVDLKERKSAVLNKTTEPFTIEDIASTVGVGAQGPQGVQGPAGPLGPVGPAGLEWQGIWVSGTSYVADDAVGYDGASWFCILATSGTTTPDLDTTHWALLASQGAQGDQGVQGPTGAQGATSARTYNIWRAKINSSSVLTMYLDEIGFTSPVITNPFNGKVLITKTGFFTGINANKLELITSTVNNGGTPFVCTLDRYNLSLNNSVVLNVFDMTGGQTGTPGCDFIVEIRVYA